MPGWTVAAGGGSWSQAGASPPSSFFPEPIDGLGFFSSNSLVTNSSDELWQEVDVTPYADAIDNSAQKFVFAGFVHSYSGDPNSPTARIIVENRVTNGAVLSSYDSGVQHATNEWMLLTNAGTNSSLAPEGTRKIRVRLITNRVTVNDSISAMFDGLLLRALPSPSSIGDGGQAINATLALPHGLSFDIDGNLYIADTYNNRVRKVSAPVGPTATITTVAGNGNLPWLGDGVTPTETTLALPMDVAAGIPSETDHSLFIADFLNHRIRGITQPTGPGSTTPIVIDTVVGTGTAGPPPANSSTWYSNEQSVLNYPTSVAFQPTGPSYTGAIWIADRSNSVIALADQFGSEFQRSTGPGFSDSLVVPPGSTLPPLGKTYRPVAVTMAGGSHGAHDALNVQYPSRSSVFVADLSNYAIRHISETGLVATVAGRGIAGNSGDGGPAYLATFMAPTALASDSNGNVYVADAEANRVRRILCANVDACAWSGSPDASAQSCIWSPSTQTINDGNACTKDQCFWTTGATHQLYAQGTSCSDGNPCNGLETCTGSVCTPPPASTWPAANSPCSDGNACNGFESCTSAHTCVSGAVPPVEDGNPCTADLCDGRTGQRTHTPVANGVSCSVGDPCMLPGTCQGGNCTGAVAIPLDTSNPCATETCQSADLNPGVTYPGVTRTLAANGSSCSGAGCTSTACVCSDGACVPSGGIGSAPALDPTVTTGTADVFAAIYGANGVQTGATVGSCATCLDPNHAALLTGTVKDAIGFGLSDVVVTVLGHPEAGQTLTRDDGQFDIVSNAGGTLTVHFAKTGYFPADRQVTAMWKGGAHVPDVAMIFKDPKVSVVTSNSNALQDALSSTITDTRGSRTERVIIPKNTSACVDAGTGTCQPGCANIGTASCSALPSISVHGTEYTVGSGNATTCNQGAGVSCNSADPSTSGLGLARMPAPLPPTSEFTYAVDLTVDEAPPGAKVTFSHPVFSYVDNFLKLTNGVGVPNGYYDPKMAQWVAEDSGVVVTITDTTANCPTLSGQCAKLDVTNNGVGDDVNDNAYWAQLATFHEEMTEDERHELALAYPGVTPASPKSVWRIPLGHFSVHDFNQGGGPPDCVPKDGGGQLCPDFDGQPVGGNDAPKQGSCTECGSIIDVETQSLGESLEVMGTPFSLNYRSANTFGYLPARTALVQFSTTSHPQLKYDELTLVTPSGSFQLERPVPARASITWNGLDAAGRRVQGSELATIMASAVYPGNYKKTGRFGSSASNETISGGFAASNPAELPDVTFTRTFTQMLTAWSAESLGLGGWQLDVHHVYDPEAKILHMGDGRSRKVDATGSVISLIAGNGTSVSAADGTPASQTGFSNYLSWPSITVAPNGDIYVAVDPVIGDGTTSIRRIDASTGKIYTVAGGGGSTADGVSPSCAPNQNPATCAMLAPTLHSTAIGADGSVYFSSQNRVRKVDPLRQTITTIAGTGQQSATDVGVDGCPTPGCIAKNAVFSDVSDVAVANDGSVYIANGGYVRRVDTSGIISTFAGTGTLGDCVDGAQATATSFPALDPVLAATSDGAIWIASGYRLMRVDPNGSVHCFVSPETDIKLSAALDNSVYYAHNGFSVAIQKLNIDGTSSTLVGGKFGTPIIGGLALTSPLGDHTVVAAGPDGSAFFMTANPGEAGYRIYRATAPDASTTIAGCSLRIPSEDGQQIFCFDDKGRHLSTRNAVTGMAIYSFAYFSDGRLNTITDADGNVTTITYGPGGATIVGPFGQTTAISLDSTTNFATSIKDAVN
ncbi:MAG TPA: hypothetical protein VGI10_15370, partial [Polyangiaceae bacterium]